MPTERTQAGSRWPLVAILALSTLLKLALLPAVERMRQRGDELQYLRGAISIAAQGVPDYGVPAWDVAHWAPVYPYLLGGARALLTERGFVYGVRALQVLASTATALLVYGLARRAFDRRVALVATAVVAFFPTFVGYTHLFLCESVFTLVYMGVAAVLAPGGHELGARRALAAGLLGGLAALTRSVFVYQSLFVVAWLLTAARGAPLPARVRRAGAFLGGMLLVVLPWSLANTLRFERFLLIDTNGGNVLHKNWNLIRQENHDIGLNERYFAEQQAAVASGLPYRRRVKTENFVDRYDQEVRAALAFVRANPLLFARQSLLRAAELVNPTSLLVCSLRKRDYGPVPAALEELLVFLVLAGTMTVLACGTIGLVVRPLDAQRLLLAALVLATVAPGVLVVSTSRYCFPLLPCLIPFAVDALLGLRSPRYRASRLRWGVALALVGLLVWAWILYVPYSYTRG